MDANGHAACRQLVKQITRTDGLFRCGSTLPAPGSVAAGAEALLHRSLCADQDEGVATHIAWNEYGLPDRAILLRYCRVVSRECTSCAFAMNTESLLLPIYSVLFYFGD